MFLFDSKIDGEMFVYSSTIEKVSEKSIPTLCKCIAIIMDFF